MLTTTTSARPPIAAAGYTLLELLVVMAVVAILASMTVPSFRDSIQRNARESAMLDLMAVISFARSEAVTRNRVVSLCRSTNQTACAASTAGDWDDGYILFADNDADGVVDAGDTLLQVQGVGNDLTKITLKTAANGNFTGDFLQVDEDGFLNNAATGAYFKMCPQNNAVADARAVWVYTTGRTAMSLTGANTVHNDLAGNDLVCP